MGNALVKRELQYSLVHVSHPSRAVHIAHSLDPSRKTKVFFPMTSSKSQTPVAVDSSHPGHALTIGNEEEKSALLKLTPVLLPNDTTVESLQHNYPKDKRWKTFRSDYRYIYVVNWMYQCRGYLKLASDHFDVDLFEIELFDLVHPPPVDDMALMVNKMKIGLLSKIHGKKIASLGSFESLFRIYFGSDTPLGGPNEEGDQYDDEKHDPTVYPRFDDLFIDEKITVLYMMMIEVTQYPDFRDFIDKNKLPPDALRPLCINFSHAKNQDTSEDYVLLFDDTALYKRVVTCPELSVPKKRKLAPKYPDEEYEEELFDVSSVKFELIYKDIYGLNDFIKTLTPKKAKRNKIFLDILTKPDFVSNIYSYEIRKRKILAHRRREFEMARLLATRKRSSRIEAKEKQRQQEEQERKLRELEELQHATSRRSRRSRNQLEQKFKMDYTDGLSREERLKMRLGLRENTESPEAPNDTIISVESSPGAVEVPTSETSPLKEELEAQEVVPDSKLPTSSPLKEELADQDNATSFRTERLNRPDLISNNAPSGEVPESHINIPDVNSSAPSLNGAETSRTSQSMLG